MFKLDEARPWLYTMMLEIPEGTKDKTLACEEAPNDATVLEPRIQAPLSRLVSAWANPETGPILPVSFCRGPFSAGHTCG